MRKVRYIPCVPAPRPSVGPQILRMVLFPGMAPTSLAVSSNRALFWFSGNTRTQSSGEASRGPIVNSKKRLFSAQLRCGVAGGFLVICFYIKDFAGVGIDINLCTVGVIHDSHVKKANEPDWAVWICISDLQCITDVCMSILFKK